MKGRKYVGVLIISATAVILFSVFSYLWPFNKEVANDYSKKTYLEVEKNSIILVPYHWIDDFENRYYGNFEVFKFKPDKYFPCINCERAADKKEVQKSIEATLAYVTTFVAQTENIMRKYNISYIATPKPQAYPLIETSILRAYIIYIYGVNRSKNLISANGPALLFNKTMVFVRFLTNFSLSASKLEKFYEDNNYIIYKLRQ